MSLHPQTLVPLPEETVRVAHAAYPKKQSLSLRIRDELGTISQDETFAHLMRTRGKMVACFGDARSTDARACVTTDSSPGVSVGRCSGL
jgi:hypothetical protein